ncbi:MAG: shikimate dehydrogenase [Allorhizobium sp.]
MQKSNPDMKAGLIGAGIQASLTPAMHMVEGRALGLDYSYAIIDLNEIDGGASRLADLISQAERDGFRGLNITHPCKQEVIGLLDSLSAEAEMLGAVNTVVLTNGKRHGHNTDWWGFAEGFRRGLPGADLRHVVQLGAGGAGAATAFAILQLGAEQVTIVDRETERAENLANTMQRLFPKARLSSAATAQTAISDATGLIHATPTGMVKHPGMPLPSEWLRTEIWVAEIVYFPLETQLLAAARARGCRVLNGGGMAVFQAVGAFNLFTGLEPDVERMLAHFVDLTAQADLPQVVSGAA